MEFNGSSAKLITACGPPGAGETTHAKLLEHSLRAVRFCPDEWMNDLSIDYHQTVEQAAFNPHNIVPGMGYSPDKVLQARLVSYPDAHRYRIGTNYESLPVNAPKCPVFTYNRDGAMRFDGNGSSTPNYEPNSFGGPKQNADYKDRALALSGEAADRYDHHYQNDDFAQAGDLFRIMNEQQKTFWPTTSPAALARLLSASRSWHSSSSTARTRTMAHASRRP